MAPDSTGSTSSSVSSHGPLHPKRVAASAKENPATSSSIFAAALCVVASKLGVDLSAEEAAILVAAAAAGANWIARSLKK